MGNLGFSTYNYTRKHTKCQAYSTTKKGPNWAFLELLFSFGCFLGCFLFWATGQVLVHYFPVFFGVIN